MQRNARNRNWTRSHPSKEELLQFFRVLDFEESEALNFDSCNISPDDYYERIYSVVVEFGRSTKEKLLYGVVIAPVLTASMGRLGEPHAHSALQWPVVHREELVQIAASHGLRARFSYPSVPAGRDLLEHIGEHMDRGNSGHFRPFFERSAHIRTRLPKERNAVRALHSGNEAAATGRASA